MNKISEEKITNNINLKRIGEKKMGKKVKTLDTQKKGRF